MLVTMDALGSSLPHADVFACLNGVSALIGHVPRARYSPLCMACFRIKTQTSADVYEWRVVIRALLKERLNALTSL